MNPDTKPFGIVNSVWGVLAQRDDGDYFRTLGAELTGQNTETGWWSWRVLRRAADPGLRGDQASACPICSTEHQLPAQRGGGPAPTRPARRSRCTAISRCRSTLQLGAESSRVEGATGDFDFGRGSATVRAIVTPRALLAVAIEASAGTSTGRCRSRADSTWAGPATLRGYRRRGRSRGLLLAGPAGGRQAFPAVRLTAFSDIGWAGPRSAFGNGRPLIGSGVGASLFDGLVRWTCRRAMRRPPGGGSTSISTAKRC